MTFEELERRFNELRGRWMAGQIDQGTFRAEAERLQLQDAEGRYWTIGVHSGKWYYFDGSNWVQGNPPSSVRKGDTMVPRQFLAPPPITAYAPAPAATGGGVPTWLWIGCGGVLAIAALVIIGTAAVLGLQWMRPAPAPPLPASPLAVATATPIPFATPAPPSPSPTPPLTPVFQGPVTLRGYSSPNLGLHIQYPNTWLFKEEPPFLIFAPDANSLDASTFRGTLFMIGVKPGAGQRSASDLLNELIATLPQRTESAPPTTFDAGGVSWSAIEAEFEAPIGPARAYAAATTYGDNGYVIMAVAPRAEYDAYSPVFQAMAQSVGFAPQVAGATAEAPTSEPTATAVVIVVTATPSPTTPPTSTPPPPGGKIAYPVFAADRQTYDIYVLDVATGTSKRVATEASEPALSKDGKRLACRSWKSDTRGLWIMNVDGGGQQRIATFFEDGLPTWSPGGGDVIFFSRRESDRRSRLYIVKAAEGVPDRSLVIGGGGEYPSYMPDGGLVFRGDINTRIGLYLGGPEGANATMITSDDSDTAPAPSPDGSLIAFMSYKRDNNWEVYVANKDGSGVRNLTKSPTNDGLPAWSPDSKSLAFVSDRNGSWAIWVMSPDGSNPHVLYKLEGSPDGRVQGEPDYASRGWPEERISWAP